MPICWLGWFLAFPCIPLFSLFPSFVVHSTISIRFLSSLSIYPRVTPEAQWINWTKGEEEKRMVAAALGGPMRCERAHRTRERMLLWRSSKMFLPLFPLFFFLSLFHEFFFLLLSFCFFFLCWAMLVFDRLEKIGSRGLKQRCCSDVRWRKEFTLRHVTSGCCLMAEFRVRLWCFKGWLDGIPTGLRVKLFGSANLFCSSEVWDRLMNERTWIF